MKDLNKISEIIHESKQLLKLDWSQNYERPGTHSVYDGTMRYFTTAPEGASMKPYYISYQPPAYHSRCSVHDCAFVMSRETLRAIVARLRSDGMLSIRVYR